LNAGAVLFLKAEEIAGICGRGAIVAKIVSASKVRELEVEPEVSGAARARAPVAAEAGVRKTNI